MAARLLAVDGAIKTLERQSASDAHGSGTHTEGQRCPGPGVRRRWLRAPCDLGSHGFVHPKASQALEKPFASAVLDGTAGAGAPANARGPAAARRARRDLHVQISRRVLCDVS